MKLLERILLAVDFDDTTDALLAGVSKFAKPFGSEVVLLHAIEPAEHGPAFGRALEATIRSRLEELRSRLAAEGVVVCDIQCPSGKTYSEIATAAERCDANLIMIGARGVAADHHFPLGTTTEMVIRRAIKPVLAVHPNRPIEFTNILCPIDFSDASARGLRNAIGLARAFDSRLHVLTVIPAPSRYHRLDRAWAQWAITAEVQVATQYVRDMNEFLERFDLRSVTWEKHIQRGDSAQQIVAVAQSVGAGLIIMGSIGRSGLPYMFMGSTAVKVAHQLPCSLLTVKRDDVLPIQVQRNANIDAAFQEVH